MGAEVFWLRHWQPSCGFLKITKQVYMKISLSYVAARLNVASPFMYGNFFFLLASGYLVACVQYDPKVSLLRATSTRSKHVESVRSCNITSKPSSLPFTLIFFWSASVR